MSTFTGFSEEDLRRIKSTDSVAKNEPQETLQINYPTKKIDKIGSVPKKTKPQYKSNLKTQTSDEILDDITFEKCRLSLKPDKPSETNSNGNQDQDHENNNNIVESETTLNEIDNVFVEDNNDINDSHDSTLESRRESFDTISTVDTVRSVANYTEDELVAHKLKLEELQLKQKLMEEQNRKRKEMLSKALADRTKQTEEEVLKLEKIKKELQVLDGQFSTDVSVLRKKIDQACLTYAEAEKHYLKVEKDFLQAKINLQKEKDKKELLTEHLCTLITHNETRKAQKLETLMYQLVDEKKHNDIDEKNDRATTPDDEKQVIVDGVDIRTGKIVDIVNS